jgi:anti-sigma-K factor RskA
MTHRECCDLLALHALDALGTVDDGAVASHVESCGSCTAELIQLREAVANLALLAPPIAPSREATRQLFAALDAGQPGRLHAMRPRRPAAAPRSRTWRRLAVRIAVAAAMAALVLSQLVLRGRLDRADREIGRMRNLGRFLSAPNVSIVPMWGAAGGHAKLAYEEDTGRFVLVSADLPPPPAGQRYEVWVIADGIRAAASVSPESPTGILAARPSGDRPFLFAISVEPPGEVAEPTGPLVLVGTLRRPGR